MRFVTMIVTSICSVAYGRGPLYRGDKSALLLFGVVGA